MHGASDSIIAAKQCGLYVRVCRLKAGVCSAVFPAADVITATVFSSGSRWQCNCLKIQLSGPHGTLGSGYNTKPDRCVYVCARHEVISR